MLTRKDGVTHEEFVRDWLEIHALRATAVRGMRRYAQSPMIGTRLRPDMPDTGVVLEGIAELWFADSEALQRAAASPEMKLLSGDGALFIGRFKTYVIEEKPIIQPQC